MSNAEKRTPGPFQQGRLLNTRVTLRWSEEQRADADALERRLVFSGFHSEDQGRGRVLVATCGRLEDAAFICLACNSYDSDQAKIKALVEALEMMKARARDNMKLSLYDFKQLQNALSLVKGE